MSEMITRADLVEIVDRATAEGCAMSTREKLLDVARTTDAVAVGWFFCGTVDCPARQARRRNQSFQTAFDHAMAERFGRGWNQEAQQPFKPFVVRVEDAIPFERQR